MRVLVTGATGLVGAHSALALLAAGHELRLYVRNAEAARRYFSALDSPVGDVVVGDIRDAKTVRAAMSGCDAVLHAAALVSLDPRRADELIENNMAGTRAVVGGACEAGITNILYVSSLEVFSQEGRSVVDESSPLGTSMLPYSRSKRECEQYVRGLQESGSPIQITYPAAVIGPDDPKLSEANRGLTTMLGAVPITSTGFQMVDARDLGDAHRWLVEHPSFNAEARYIIGGRYQPWAEMRRLLCEATGRRIFAPPVPGSLLRGIGVAIDALKALVPFNTQLSADAMTIATKWTPADSSRYAAKSGLGFRPTAETLADAIRWMAQAGHVKAERAGRLAAC